MSSTLVVMHSKLQGLGEYEGKCQKDNQCQNGFLCGKKNCIRTLSDGDVEHFNCCYKGTTIESICY